MDEGLKLIGTAMAIGIGSLAPAIGIGMMAASGLKAIGKNPDAENKIRTNMILAIAFAEAIAIYALVVSLIIKFT